MFITDILGADFKIFSEFPNLLCQNEKKRIKKHPKTDQKIKILKTW